MRTQLAHRLKGNVAIWSQCISTIKNWADIHHEFVDRLCDAFVIWWYH